MQYLTFDFEEQRRKQNEDSYGDTVVVTSQLNGIDPTNTIKFKIERAIDEEFADHRCRVMLKLFMSDCKNYEIARRAEVEHETLTLALYDCGRRLERRLGFTLVDLREIYVGRKQIWG